jgi:hypothetical protein
VVDRHGRREALLVRVQCPLTPMDILRQREAAGAAALWPRAPPHTWDLHGWFFRLVSRMPPLSSSSVLSFDADGESPMVEDIDKDPGMHTPKLSSFINHASLAYHILTLPPACTRGCEIVRALEVRSVRSISWGCSLGRSFSVQLVRHRYMQRRGGAAGGEAKWPTG